MFRTSQKLPNRKHLFLFSDISIGNVQLPESKIDGVMAHINSYKVPSKELK